MRARFMYGMVLMGLAILQQEAQGKKDKLTDQEARGEAEEDEDNIEDKVEQFSKAIAPVLLPMIEALGALDLEESAAMVASGEST